AASAARLYYENAHATPPTTPTTTPIGLAAFGGDFSGIRRFAERDHTNIVHWSTFDHGGHFAAHKAPDLLVDDLRLFFRGLRCHSRARSSTARSTAGGQRAGVSGERVSWRPREVTRARRGSRGPGSRTWSDR